MFIKKLLLLLLYTGVGVVFPIYGLNTDYGWSVIVGFWIPIALLSIFILPKISSSMRKAFFATCVVLVPVTVAFEYIGLSLDIWNFSEEYSKLWGIKLFGAPVEEFIFWFGATPLCLLLYLCFTSTKGVKNESA
jgi:lycopene cyclase domain-containing protein